MVETEVAEQCSPGGPQTKESNNCNRLFYTVRLIMMIQHSRPGASKKSQILIAVSPLAAGCEACCM
jgi:hypothetical protein